MTAALILYEDSRAGNGDFGPHELIMSLAADQMAVDLWAIRRQVGACPLNGVGNLLMAISNLERFRALVPGGAPILVVIDADKIRDHLRLTNADAQAVEVAIFARCDQPNRLTVALLEENTESLIQAAADCDKPPSLPRDQVNGALAKDINARDVVFFRVARTPGHRALRDCIRGRVPSIEKAIAFVVRRCAA